MEQTLNHGMCRCCASEGMFKNFSATYQWMGADEVYADMLKECFDISLTTADDWNNGGICEVCITQLRNASNFRKQVLQTEDQFKKALQDKLYKDSIVKVEVNRDEDDLDSDNNVSDFSGTEFEVPVKEELEETKTKKRTAKATTSRAKKAKTEDGEPSSKRKGQEIKNSNPLKQEKSESEGQEIKVPNPLENETKESNEIKEEQKSVKKPTEESKKHLSNLKNILQYSNATLFRDKDRDGYKCNFCMKKYQLPKNLKTHFLQEHNNFEAIKLPKVFQYVLKIDITELSCKICVKAFDKLEDFTNHLQQEHKKTFHTDIKNQMIPFKFDSDTLRCAICATEFTNYKVLLEHMHVHFKNFVCDICDSGFVTKMLLFRHKRLHKMDSFKCNTCEKVFSCDQKRKDHEKRMHLGLKKNHKCHFCQEKFADYWNKINHLIKEHGAPPVVLKCQACDRSFQNQRALSRHTKKDHLLERKHKCTECEMTFFTTTCLQRHMAKHTGLRQFRCDVCFKAYGRKNTLKQHMRIHADDRRFGCTHCGMAFVQMCSFRSHMRSKHGEEV